MTATDELRRLLDERGARWEDMSDFGVAATEWWSDDGSPCTALESDERPLLGVPDGKLSVEASITPEQAVEATLGMGTCRFIDEDNFNETEGCDAYSWFRCSACGWMFDECDRWLTTMSYCPNCGRRIEEDA